MPASSPEVWPSTRRAASSSPVSTSSRDGAFQVPVALRHDQVNALLVSAVGAGGIGLASDPVPVRVIHDDVPPTVTLSMDPPANAAGWHRSAVRLSYVCADTLSGVALCPPAISFTTEGGSQAVSATALDRAGNSVTQTVVLNIDITPPEV